MERSKDVSIAAENSNIEKLEKSNAVEENRIHNNDSKTAPPVRKKKKVAIRVCSWVAAILIICSFAGWLCYLGEYYRTPIPGINSFFAKFISDYYNLYIGMPYDDVIDVLGESIVETKGEPPVQCNLYTKNIIDIDGKKSEYQIVGIDDGKVEIVFLMFSPESASFSDFELYSLCNLLERHYSELFGSNDSTLGSEKLKISVYRFDSDVAVVFSQY